MTDPVQHARELAMEAKADLSQHEAVCAERYMQIKDSLKYGGLRMQKIESVMSRMQYMLIGVGILLLLGSEKVSVIDMLKGWMK